MLAWPDHGKRNGTVHRVRGTYEGSVGISRVRSICTPASVQGDRTWRRMLQGHRTGRRPSAHVRQPERYRMWKRRTVPVHRNLGGRWTVLGGGYGACGHHPVSGPGSHAMSTVDGTRRRDKVPDARGRTDRRRAVVLGGGDTDTGMCTVGKWKGAYSAPTCPSWPPMEDRSCQTMKSHSC
ncbi:hypothetical protein JB92DRAFT_1303895 [Gautieria morchelliformis]|nr:hypothetical protein JB92DRAFT_1303895 [Gautieria morchelliformis]